MTQAKCSREKYQSSLISFTRADALVQDILGIYYFLEGSFSINYFLGKEAWLISACLRDLVRNVPPTNQRPALPPPPRVRVSRHKGGGVRGPGIKEGRNVGNARCRNLADTSHASLYIDRERFCSNAATLGLGSMAAGVSNPGKRNI